MQNHPDLQNGGKESVLFYEKKESTDGKEASE